MGELSQAPASSSSQRTLLRNQLQHLADNALNTRFDWFANGQGGHLAESQAQLERLY